MRSNECFSQDFGFLEQLSYPIRNQQDHRQFARVVSRGVGRSTGRIWLFDAAEKWGDYGYFVLVECLEERVYAPEPRLKGGGRSIELFGLRSVLHILT